MNYNFNNVENAYGINNVELKRIYGSNNYLLWEKPDVDYEEWLTYINKPITIEALGDGEISLVGGSTAYYKKNGEISFNSNKVVDVTGWNQLSPNGRVTEITVSTGDIIYVLGQVRFDSNTYTPNINLAGNIQSVRSTEYFLQDYEANRWYWSYNNTSTFFYNYFRLNYVKHKIISVKNLVFPKSIDITFYGSIPSNLGIRDGAFSQLFQDCTNLLYAPYILPPEELQLKCYCDMFRGCTSLIKAPKLPAMTLAQSCYNSMFYGCTSLSYIKCLATDISANNCTGSWLYNTSSTGTFVKAAGVTWSSGSSGIPTGWNINEI